MDSPGFFPTRIGERASASHAHCHSETCYHLHLYTSNMEMLNFNEMLCISANQVLASQQTRDIEPMLV